MSDTDVEDHGHRTGRDLRERGRGPARRWPRRLLGVLVVLVVLGGGLLVAAPLLDDAVRGVAERRVAEQLVTETGATGGVDVSVAGRWFVPQLLAGRYPRVGVVARGVPTGEGLRLETVDADLRGVSAPLREVLGGGGVAVERSSVEAELAYPVLNAYLRERDDPLRVAPEAGGGLLRVTGSTRLLGTDLALSADVDLQVDADSGELRAVPRELDTDNALVDGLSRSVLRGLRDQLAFTVPLEALPLEQRLVSARASSTGIVVTTEGSSIVVGS